MSNLRILMPSLVLVALIFLLPACGSGIDEGDDSGGGIPETCTKPFSLGLTGSWVFQEILDGESCATGGLNQGTFFLLQDGRTLTFQGEQTLWQGTLCGSRATGGPFSIQRDGGVHTVNTILIQFSSENKASGTTTWSWTNGSENCEGTSTFDMMR